jgi:hypothetical protein
MAEAVAVEMMEDGTGKKGESWPPAKAEPSSSGGWGQCACGRFMRMDGQVRVDGFVVAARGQTERITGTADLGSWLRRLSPPPFVRLMAFGVYLYVLSCTLVVVWLYVVCTM